jgi:hypothetical protein
MYYKCSVIVINCKAVVYFISLAGCLASSLRLTIVIKAGRTQGYFCCIFFMLNKFL